jgi:hypothetical protein
VPPGSATPPARTAPGPPASPATSAPSGSADPAAPSATSVLFGLAASSVTWSVESAITPAPDALAGSAAGVPLAIPSRPAGSAGAAGAPGAAWSGRLAALLDLDRPGLVSLGEASMEVISPGPAGPISAPAIGSSRSAAPTGLL